MLENVLLILMEGIGTVAFATSGALVAISCSLDLFGVIIVGCITAVGGGLIRDLFIGNLPPRIFLNQWFLLLAVITSVIVFIIAYSNAKKFKNLREKIEKINIIFDALGLAIFSVTGVQVTCAEGFSENAIFAITLGLITGVGGGVLRDVFVNEKPYILTKHIYAVASIVGCCTYYFIGVYLKQIVLGTIVSVALVMIIRILAATFHWKLPKIKIADESQN